MSLSGLLNIVILVFSIWATVDILLTRKEDIRHLYKIFWLVTNVVFGPFASLGWLLLGRPRKSGPLPGGNKGSLAQVGANAGIDVPARLIAPTAIDASTSSENPADQSGLEELAPEATTVIDLTEPVQIQPGPLGPEDSQGWTEWAANEVNDNPSKD